MAKRGCADDDSHQPSKRLREEPDLTIIVGEEQVEFQCYSQVLRYASEYIDTMLGSNMREANEKVIRFPHMNPEGWKVFYPFLEPRTAQSVSNTTITMENICALLPWFHEFGMTNMIEECDKVYELAVEDVVSGTIKLHTSLSPLARMSLSEKVWNGYERFLARFCRYDLRRSEEKLVAFISTLLSRCIDWSDPDFMETFLPMLLANERWREYFWPLVETYLPEGLRNKPPEELVAEKSFPYLLAERERSQNKDCYRAKLNPDGTYSYTWSPPGKPQMHGNPRSFD